MPSKVEMFQNAELCGYCACIHNLKKKRIKKKQQHLDMCKALGSPLGFSDLTSQFIVLRSEKQITVWDMVDTIYSPNKHINHWTPSYHQGHPITCSLTEKDNQIETKINSFDNPAPF